MSRLILLCLLFLAANVSAQKITISGTVKRAENNEALLGATINIKNTSRGTITDADGKYSIKLPEKFGTVTLVAKYIGFKDQEVTVVVSDKNIVTDFSLVSNNEQLEDVIVTANKTEEYLQRVNVAATVVSSKTMFNSSSYTSLEALRRTPLMVTDSWVTSQPSFSIRGLANNFDNVGFESTVGLYLDDVYYSRPFIFNSSIFDLDRIEVLRGPQGTMFGKNTIGGVVNLISEKPTFSDNGQIELIGGNFQFTQARGKINKVLVKDKLAFRLTGSFANRNGYIPDPDPDVQSENKYRFYGGRASLFYRPNAKTSADLKFFAGKDDHAEQTMIFLSKPEYDPLGIPATTISNNRMGTPQPFNRTQYGSSLKLSRSLPNSTLTSITAGNFSNDYVFVDWDNTELHVADWGREQGLKSFSQEVRIASPRDKKIAYIGGLYFQKERITGRDTSTLNEDFLPLAEEFLETTFGPIPNYQEEYAVHSTINTSNAAAFGSLSVLLNSKLKLNVGARLTHEKRDFRFYQNIHYMQFNGKPVQIMDIYATQIASANDPLKTSTIDNVLTGDIGLDYLFSANSMSYLKATRGYKGSGFNTSVTLNTDVEKMAFRPEFVNSLEWGFKTKLSSRIRLNGALFFADYIDKQEFLDEGVKVTILNAAKTNGFGGETEFSWMQGNYQLDVSSGFLNMKYRDFIFGQDENGDDIDFSGNKLLKAPSVTLSVNQMYSKNIGENFRTTISADVSYSGKSYNDISNSEVIARKPMGILDGRWALFPRSNKWSMALWGKNLTNTIYYQHGWEYDWGDQVSIGRLRSFGAEVLLNF